MRKSLLTLGALVALALCSAGQALAQCSSQSVANGVTVQTNYQGTTCDATRGNFQQTDPSNSNSASVLLGTLTTASTVNSTQFTNYNGRGVECTYVQTNESGSPSVTVAIQAYDAASATYLTLASNATVFSKTSTMPQKLYVYPGIQTATLPTGVAAATGLQMPRLWRVQAVITGASGPAVTYTVGCNVTN